MRRLAIAAFLGALALAACGVRGPPRPPLRDEPATVGSPDAGEPFAPADAGCPGCAEEPLRPGF